MNIHTCKLITEIIGLCSMLSLATLVPVVSSYTNTAMLFLYGITNNSGESIM